MKKPIRIALWVVGALVVAFAGLALYAVRTVLKADYVIANGRSVQDNVAGRWDWATRATPCSDSTHTIAFSDDGRTMTITMQFPVVVDSGERDWSVTTYDILKTTPSRIRGAIRGETRMTDDGKPVVWDLVVTGDNEYSWYRTDWPSWGRTSGNIRCGDALAAADAVEVANLTQPDPPILAAKPSTEARPLSPAISAADRFRGYVLHNQLPGQKVALELSIFSRDDSTTTAWLESGAPLNIRGITWLLQSEDSLFLVTNTATDTIVWASATLPETGRVGGEYWVSAGMNPGMGGTWQLNSAPRLSRFTLALTVGLISGALLLGMFVIAAHGADRWWAWRAKRPIGGTEIERRKLTGVGGWLILVIVGQSIVALTQTFKISELGEALGGTWMLGTSIAWLRPLLLGESAFHVLQIVGIIGGVVLITRRSRMAPVYWMTFLAIMATYGIGDIAMTGVIHDEMVGLFGAGAAADMDAQGQAAAAINGRLALFAMLWMLYWARSRRVALTFAPSPWSVAQAPSVSSREDVSGVAAPAYTIPDPNPERPQVTE